MQSMFLFFQLLKIKPVLIGTALKITGFNDAELTI